MLYVLYSIHAEKGKWTDKADYQVVFLRDGQIVETNNFNISK